MTVPSESEFQVEFLRKLQRLLDEGSFVATYKFALLHALADICIEKHVIRGEPLRITIGDIAEKVIAYYWRQIMPYRPMNTHSGILAQNSGNQAAILRELREAQDSYGTSITTLVSDAVAWRRLVGRVAQTIKAMPLWKLQTLGSVEEADEFLYQKDTFDAVPTRIVDQTIKLGPGVADTFRAFHGLIVNMIRGGWVRTLRGMSQNRSLLDRNDDLFEFLFESSRANLSRVADLLRDYQNNRCFYCHQEIRGQPHVDHFVPWSRYPVDLAHNFVLTDAKCNGDKRDHLASEDHLERWVESRVDISLLDDDFVTAGVLVDNDRSRHVARWAYEQAESAHAHGWKLGKQFETIDSRWRYILPA
jgi:5-methylcytosine-specific restriction endonuclease McrA